MRRILRLHKSTSTTGRTSVSSAYIRQKASAEGPAPQSGTQPPSPVLYVSGGLDAAKGDSSAAVATQPLATQNITWNRF